MRVGIEVGGTFTDLVCNDRGTVSVRKVPSTPAAPEVGFANALAAAGVSLANIEELVHGSTVATNAVLERKGARIALITTAGFRDLLWIQRQDKSRSYDLAYTKPSPPVARGDVIEIRERIAADGSIVVGIDRTRRSERTRNTRSGNDRIGSDHMKLIRWSAAAVLVASLVNAAHAETVLRIVPQGDLRVLDPVWTTSQLTQAHALLVYDQLFAVDSRGVPRPAMVDTWTESSDGLVWRFSLRPGLTFSDGSALTSRDVVPSIQRWAKRSADGQFMLSRTAAIEADGDAGFLIRLSRPYAGLLATLASPTQPLFVMREREALTDAFKQIDQVVGSGPFEYVKDESRQGSLVVYRRNAYNRPRRETPDGMAGGRIAKVDRVEWRIMPDTSTAVAALTKGEVDVLESTPYDLIPVLAGNRDVRLTVVDTMGQQAMLRFNALAAPFNNPRIRRAVLFAMNRGDYLQAVVGDTAYSQDCLSIYICGTPAATLAGAEPFAKPSIEAAQRALREAGYGNERVVILDPVDHPILHPITLVTADRLKAMGMNVDVQAMDWAQVVARRSNRDDPAKNGGGWSIFHTINPSVTMNNPITNYALVTSCDGKNWFGWPCDETLESIRQSYADAATPADRTAVLEALQRRYWETVPYVSLGQITKPVGHRANVSGFVQSPILAIWNVEKLP